jgi:hypothetical protein
MTETNKTLLFLVVAAVAVAAAVANQWTSQPAADKPSETELCSIPDPLAVTDMDIVEFNEATSTLRPFRVAQSGPKGKERWSIPSHENYPADAKDQMALAASGLMGLKTIEIVSEDQGDQETYGVVEPDPSKPQVGATGVGMRVVMKDRAGKTLLALVIGKEVPGQPGLRYARKTGENTIRVVAVKTDKLSTRFHDWIERNLLQINTFDLKQIWIQDYYVDVMNGELAQRADLKIDYDDAAEKRWKLIEDLRFNDIDKKLVKMPPGEELNTAKLDDLVTALGNLKIIDVSRKPAGLSEDLKASKDFALQADARPMLASKGFFLAELEGQDGMYLFSNDGEIHLQMKDGVEYVLRFGGLAGGSGEKTDDKAKSKNPADNPDDKEESRLNRYLFVMAQFNPKVIAKPKLLPLPEKKDIAKQLVEKKGDAKKPDEKNPAAKTGSDESRRIEKENKRRMDEYESTLADGKKRVAELNARFAEWYYVISDDVYGKIHLTREDLVQKKPKAKPGKPGPNAQGSLEGGTAVPLPPPEYKEPGQPNSQRATPK